MGRSLVSNKVINDLPDPFPKVSNINVIETTIEGVVIIEPRIFEDARGYFFESFSQREFEEKVRPIRFVQDNESKSSYGVMRGLHF